METFGEDVSEKATDEFADAERHAGVAISTYGTGRTNLLSGIVDLVLLATYSRCLRALSVWIDDQPIHLIPKEYRIFELLSLLTRTVMTKERFCRDLGPILTFTQTAGLSEERLSGVISDVVQ